MRRPTSSFTGISVDAVKEIHTVQVEWVKDPDGRFGPREIPGTSKVYQADLVLLALGFVGPEKEGLLASGRPRPSSG